MKRLLLIFTIVLSFTVPANAELQNLGTDSRGNRLIYDSDLNITWYDYTNSLNRWQDQVDWAEALTVNFGGNVYEDWRLPITFDDSCFSNCTNSEMGHLYYTELGLENMLYGEIIANAGDFQNLQSVIYWSDTKHSYFTQNAWVFDFSNGNQAPLNDVNDYECISNVYDCYSGVAVRSGLAVVPEPISSILFLTGGGVLAGRRFFTRKPA